MSDFFFSEDITYCMDGECLRTECIRHRSRAPIGVPLSWANMKYQEGCIFEKIKALASVKDIDVPNTDLSDYSDRLWKAAYERGYRDALELLDSLPSKQSEVREIDYRDCSNAMLKMWIDKVLTDGEYNKIMDKLNAYEMKKREVEER